MIRNALAVVIGFVAASAVMMSFEYANHLLYAFPDGLETSTVEALRTFAASLPLKAMILVVLGWITGSFVAGWVCTNVAVSHKHAVATVVGALLTVGGIVNAWMIQNPLWVFLCGLPLFFVFTYLGYRVAVRGEGT
jgi:hypothetical protein